MIASAARAALFGFFGFKDYTKFGYERAAKYFDPKALDVDLSNHTAIVSGANSGLGKTAALELAKRGATVHILCRNAAKGAEARAEIISKSNNNKVYLHQGLKF